MSDKITIQLGALAKPLTEQLPETNRELVDQWQADADAIVRLSVRGLLTGYEKGKAYHRLLRRMEREINE